MESGERGVQSGRDEMIRQIENARFHTNRFRGYDETEVDDFLEFVVDTLRRGESPDGDELRDVGFSVRRLVPSYSMEDVDELIDEIRGYVARSGG
jgi:DivIVA domain-containing protein